MSKLCVGELHPHRGYLGVSASCQIFYRGWSRMTAAAETWTFDGVVRLTRIGTSYLVFTLVIGFAAINTGNNALYIGLTFMLGCLLLSGVASKGGLKHLDVELRGLDEAWAGRDAEAILRVTNRSRIW